MIYRILFGILVFGLAVVGFVTNGKDDSSQPAAQSQKAAAPSQESSFQGLGK